MDGIRDWIGMVAIFWKSRSFPLVSVRLSRALGWNVGAMGAVWGGFGGDVDGFSGLVGGLGAFGMARDCLNQDFWD